MLGHIDGLILRGDPEPTRPARAERHAGHPLDWACRICVAEARSEFRLGLTPQATIVAAGHRVAMRTADVRRRSLAAGAFGSALLGEAHRAMRARALAADVSRSSATAPTRPSALHGASASISGTLRSFGFKSAAGSTRRSFSSLGTAKRYRRRMPTPFLAPPALPAAPRRRSARSAELVVALEFGRIERRHRAVEEQRVRQPRPSRNRRAKASKVTGSLGDGEHDRARSHTPTPLRIFAEVPSGWIFGWILPSMISIGPDWVA